MDHIDRKFPLVQTCLVGAVHVPSFITYKPLPTSDAREFAATARLFFASIGFVIPVGQVSLLAFIQIAARLPDAACRALLYLFSSQACEF